MFWALISPFRHTAEPPRLAQDSPLRIGFYNVGSMVTRHPAHFIVGSVTCAVILSYPCFLLYTTASTGLPSVPHHVWSSARQFSSVTAAPDVAIKQAWVQGSYMGALTPEVVEEGLKVQEALLGSDVLCTETPNSGDAHSRVNSLPSQGLISNASSALPLGVFFHSPLLYWNCSLSAIQQDSDLLETVNANAMRVSPLNMTLYWSSVFAGKLFSHQRLAAADALVISLFYDTNSKMGELWDERATALASDANLHVKYDIYPPDGKVRRNTFYEFFFQPMSNIDYFVLTACYALTTFYLYIQLNRAGTVRSRTGLIVAILTQLAASVMSSFTILACLKYPVTHIPRGVFPFVVMVIGVENIVRLMNAVKDTPPQQLTSIRVATAVGEVGFLSSVAVVFDIVILTVVGHVSFPAVTEFCWFAGIALAVDFVLHFSYFLAVLSVDVQRLELQDSLSTKDPNWDRRGAFPKGGFRGFVKRTPVSTRIAGSAIMICALIALNMHFFDNETPWRTFQAIRESLQTQREPAEGYALPTSMPLNQARTPKSWIKLQDQLTGKELIQILKPGEHRLIAKVYDPLFVVLKGSNRLKAKKSFSDFVNFLDLVALKDHLLPFVLIVVVAAAGVTLLMNQLLSKGSPNDMDGVEPGEGHGEPMLGAKTLHGGHHLDVVMAAASPKGFVVSVGLDRRIVVWDLKGKWGPIKDIISPACSEHLLWPVMGLALDNLGEWLAIAPRTGRISLWQIKESTFYRSFSLELHEQTPSAFFFAPRQEDHAYGPRLIVVRQNGWLSEVCVLTGQMYHHRICDGIVVSSSHGVSTHKMSLRIVTACRQGRLFVTSRQGEWCTEQLYVQTLVEPLTRGDILSEPCTIIPLHVLGMVVSSRECNVNLVDLLSGNIVKSFQIGQCKASTLRAFHAKRRTCLYCGCPSVESFSIAYTERDSSMFIMHTFAPTKGRSKYICLRAERDRREKKCTGFEQIEESTHWMENVEGWEPTSSNLVAGIRRIDHHDAESSDDYAYSLGTEKPGLRQRRKRGKSLAMGEEGEWEAWAMSFDGEVTRYALADISSGSSGKGLLVSRTGPVTRVGQRSIAVGFGNTIKIIHAGVERFDDEDDYDDIAAASHRRRVHRR